MSMAKSESFSWNDNLDGHSIKVTMEIELTRSGNMSTNNLRAVDSSGKTLELSVEIENELSIAGGMNLWRLRYHPEQLDGVNTSSWIASKSCFH